MFKWLCNKIAYLGKWVINIIKRIGGRIKKDLEKCKGNWKNITYADITAHLSEEMVSFFGGAAKVVLSRRLPPGSTLGCALNLVSNPYESAFVDGGNVVAPVVTCLKSFCSRRLFGAPLSSFNLNFKGLTSLLPAL